MSTLHQEPWRELSPALASMIEPELPALRDEILAVIASEVPEYRRPFEGAFGRGLRLGVDEALGQFARLVADPDSGRAQSSEVYRGLGRGEMREGRGLESLQAAYRLGARVAWRRLSAVGLREGLAPEVLCALADAIFAYIDELAADSVEGFTQAQQAAAGERERRRRRLLTVLLRDPFDADALRAAAVEAGWKAPGSVAVLVCEPADADRVARRLPIETLASVVEELGCIAISDPDGPGRRLQLERACEGVSAALGPTVAPDGARGSWVRARSAWGALRAGAITQQDVAPRAIARGAVVGGAVARGAVAGGAVARGAVAGGAVVGGLCIAEAHLTEIAFFEAREPLRELSRRALAPMDSLTPAAHDRMTTTLRAFLDHRGNAPAMAEALHVHPQTVRYRLKRLRELFGEALDDPDTRFELETAVRVTT